MRGRRFGLGEHHTGHLVVDNGVGVGAARIDAEEHRATLQVDGRKSAAAFALPHRPPIIGFGGDQPANHCSYSCCSTGSATALTPQVCT